MVGPRRRTGFSPLFLHPQLGLSFDALVEQDRALGVASKYLRVLRRFGFKRAQERRLMNQRADDLLGHDPAC